MKFAAMAVTLAFAASPALAQQYPAANSPSPANPAATDQATPGPTDQATPGASSSDDARMASNQAKHHKRSQSSSSQGQMGSSQASPNQETQAPATPSPAPQQ